MKKTTNKRAIISIGLFASFIITPVTALLIHATHGSLISHSWLHIHVVFGVLFGVFGFLHLVYNWRTFKNYIIKKK